MNLCNSLFRKVSTEMTALRADMDQLYQKDTLMRRGTSTLHINGNSKRTVGYVLVKCLPCGKQQIVITDLFTCTVCKRKYKYDDQSGIYIIVDSSVNS